LSHWLQVLTNFLAGLALNHNPPIISVAEIIEMSYCAQPNNPIKNGQKTKHFSKSNSTMASKHMKRCSTSLITREIQIKITIR
jgi:hypothetical protein